MIRLQEIILVGYNICFITTERRTIMSEKTLRDKININDLVIQDEDGNCFLPYTIDVRLINGKVLKALARIEYGHLVIADIAILDKHGRTIIQYPQKEFEDKKTGEMKSATIAFPNHPETSKAFNRGILQVYKDMCEIEYFKRVSGAQ